MYALRKTWKITMIADRIRMLFFQALHILYITIKRNVKQISSNDDNNNDDKIKT